MNRTLPIISSFTVALALFLLVNSLAGKQAAEQTIQLQEKDFTLSDDARRSGRPSSWWLTHAWLQGKRPPDIFIFGSSQMGGVQAADAKALGHSLDWVLDHHSVTMEKNLDSKLGIAGSSVFICGLPGAMVSDYYLIARALFSKERKPALVILTVAPRDFIDNFLPQISATEPFRFFSPYLATDKAAYALMFPDFSDRVRWQWQQFLRLRNICRFADLSKQISNYLPSNIVPSAGNAITNPWLFSLNSDDAVRPGQCVVSPNMPQTFVDNSKEYARRYRNCKPPFFQEELRFFDACLSLLQNQGTKILVVDMPLTFANRCQLPPQFWDQFRQYLKNSCAKKNRARCLDLSDSSDFIQSDFVDTVHLNARGGAKLLQILVNFIADNNELAGSIQHR